MARTFLPSKPPRRFKLFPQLPTEIRIMIWTFCLPNPRVVDVKMRRKSIPTSTGEHLDVSRFISSVDYPIILHVCHESRSLAREHYKLAFPKMTSTEWSPAKIYIDFSADTVWFDNLRYFPNTPSRSAPKAVPLGDFRRIKRLAMRHPMDRVLLDSTKLFDPEHFPALEEIYIVDTRLQPHPVVLRTYGRYKSKAFDQVWGEETKRPVVHLAEVQEIEEACQKSV